MAIKYDGDSESFSYTGNVQSWVCPKKGLYKLEVWGAKGGDNWSVTQGGYTSALAELSEGDTLYICCGGMGENGYRADGDNSYRINGGYNGGGFGYSGNGDDWASASGTSGGGGATHIAKGTNRGTLVNYINNKDEVLIVGGGGGGNGSWRNWDDEGWHDNVAQGTHGNISATSNHTLFGQAPTNVFSANGGGWLCGNDGINLSGGTGYISSALSTAITYRKKAYTTQGITYGGNTSGNGYAKITMVARGCALAHFGGNDYEVYVSNGNSLNQIDSIFVGSTEFGS